MANGKSLTVHASQGHAAPLHDKREYTPPNACRALEANNVSVVRVEDDVQAFNDFFEPHVTAYNDKQKRADRKKSLDYHAEVVERRARSKDPEHETKPFYEYVIGVGDRDGVMGVTDSGFDNAHWRRLKDGYTDEDGNEVAPDYEAADEYVRAHLNAHPDRDGLKQALTAHMEGLQERYPNFRFVCIEGHDDEPNGTFHFHVRFFPVAEGYKNGMATRCGLNKALAAMGFSGGEQLPITQWQNDVKDGLESVLNGCGYEREHGDGRKYRLDTASYALSEELGDLARETAETMAEMRNRVENMQEQIEWAAGERDSALADADAAEKRRKEAEAAEANAKAGADAAEKRRDDAQAVIDGYDENLKDAEDAYSLAVKWKGERDRFKKEAETESQRVADLKAEHARIAASPPEVKVTLFDADPADAMPSILEAAADWYTTKAKNENGKSKQRSETMALLFREAAGDLGKVNHNKETLLSRMVQFIRARMLKQQSKLGDAKESGSLRMPAQTSVNVPSAGDREIGG